MKTNPIFPLLLALAMPLTGRAQYAWQEDAEAGKLDLGHGINYRVEAQASFSNEKTPLWLNANRYGLSSLEKGNGYVRGQLIRPLGTDSARRWGIGYGVDVAVPVHYTSDLVVQQAFVEARWLHGTLSVGSKEYPMEMKNQRLSSGSQALGINARPVPQVRLALPKYWTLPIFHRWVHLKGHIAYGRFTDDNWQRDFTQKQSKYTEDVLYHSKAGYLKIGNPDRFVPWSLEAGLEMATQFGGTSYTMKGGQMVAMRNNRGIGAFYDALFPSGNDVGEGYYGNVAGNTLGSWVARWNYEKDAWAIHVYADHFFEDHSAMFHLDYNGYGTGDEWNVKKDRKFVVYKFKDIMLGTELNLKHGKWLRNIVVEYLYTKYQSGPYNHDHTYNISDHWAGMDDYYNNYIYTGWQHWGQVMGNPLYRSPIYNSDGRIQVDDNRFMAFHLGFDGSPSERLDYRVLATWQEGLGTYRDPYYKKRHNVSFMAEATYRLPHGWTAKGSYGMDFGSILGHNAGFQMTVAKSGVFNL